VGFQRTAAESALELSSIDVGLDDFVNETSSECDMGEGRRTEVSDDKAIELKTIPSSSSSYPSFLFTWSQNSISPRGERCGGS